MSADAVVRASGVSVRYGQRTVVDQLSLEVLGGEVVALLGPNGCGKSTALKAMLGLVPLAAGAVEVLGRQFPLDDTIRRDIGAVVDGVELFPFLSAERAVATLCRLRGADVAKSSLRESLAAFGVDVSRRPLRKLSEGNRKRAALAASAVLQPTLTCWDEPTNALDLESRARIVGAVRDIERRGGSLIVATHDFEFAELVASRAIAMSDGRVVGEVECRNHPIDLRSWYSGLCGSLAEAAGETIGSGFG